jgi:hypothetical protein
LRYPERELVHVDAFAEHYKPLRPLETWRSGSTVVSLADVTGRRHLETGYGTVTIPAEHSAAALEVMSRFAVEPESLLWLPPTMAPCSSSSVDGYLEHPAEALADYRKASVDRVVCQEKHMGSRAVVLVRHGNGGAIYTRTGRSFFDSERTDAMLERIRRAIAQAGLWKELDTDWLLLDCELLPWSAKAEDLIKSYAAVGSAGRAALPAALGVLEAAASRGLDVSALSQRLSASLRDVEAYTEAYRQYAACDAVTLAPFAVLAGARGHFAGRDHGWHLSLADRLVEADPELFTPTRRLELDLSEEDAVARATEWWLELTSGGGEGMVVKPFEGLMARGRKGLHQPGIKCRGREYLRIIYGPSYVERLETLRARGLGRKRAMALREHALGLSALENVAANGPFYRTHQLVFAILASESEPVDARL